MKRIVLMAMAVFGVIAACLPFDEELMRARLRLSGAVDGGVFAGGSSGGGSATAGGSSGGNSGGMVGGGNSGGTAGGSSGGMVGGGSSGGSQGGGTGDAGLPPCNQFFCLRGLYETDELAFFSGVVASPSGAVVAVGSRPPQSGGTNFLGDEEGRPSPDGGMTLTRLSSVMTGYGVYGIAGTPSDYWVTNASRAIHRRADGRIGIAVIDCGLDYERGYWDIWIESANVAVVSTADFGYCRIEDNGTTFVQTKGIDHTMGGSGNYLYGYYATDAGEEYVVGESGRVHDVDGGAVSDVLDSTPEFGLVDIDGFGEDVWAIGRSGVIAQRRSNGRFETVFTANTALYDLAVVGPSEAYAVGSGRALFGWDGTDWRRVPLQNLGTMSTVRGVAVAGSLVHLVGSLDNSGSRAFLMTLQRGSGAWPDAGP